MNEIILKDMTLRFFKDSIPIPYYEIDNKIYLIDGMKTMTFDSKKS